MRNRYALALLVFVGFTFFYRLESLKSYRPHALIMEISRNRPVHFPSRIRLMESFVASALAVLLVMPAAADNLSPRARAWGGERHPVVAPVRERDVSGLIREALQHHPALRAQASAQEAARAGVEGAQWQYWPTPSIGAEQANSNNDPTYRGDRIVTTLRLQQPLWTGGRLDGNLDKAEAQARVAEADLEATRQQIALRVIQAWSDAAAAQIKVAAYEQGRDVHARLLGLVERRTREGASAQADIDLARSRLDGTDADLASAHAQRATALDKLRLLTGRPVSAGELGNVSGTLPPALTQKIDELLTAARAQSPQLVKAHAHVQIAEAEVTLAKATLSPEVHLRVERQYGSFNLPGQYPQNRIFIGVSTAFGGGLSSLSGLDGARARRRAAQDDIQTQQLAVDEQVHGDATLSRTSGERRARLERARFSSAEVAASWERQFLAGRKQWQDLMNAAREQMQNDIQLADAIATQHLIGWRLAILTLGVGSALERQPQAVDDAREATRRTPIATEAATAFVSPAEPLVQPTDDPSTAITAAVDAWFDAWRRRDANTYLAAYTGDYRKAPDINRAAWEAGVRQRLQRLTELHLERGELELTHEGSDRAVVRFRQTYRTARWQDVTQKTLHLSLIGDRWLIAGESAVPAP